MFVFVYLKASSKANSDAKLPLSFEETGGFSAACCSAQGCSWVSGLAGEPNGQQLIKTGDAPPPLFPTRHSKPFLSPAIPRSLPHPCRQVHTGALFSSLFIFSYRSFSSVQCFCLSDSSHWVIRMASLPRLRASLWTEGRAVYDRNNMQTDRKINHMWPQQSLSPSLVSQCCISPSEVVFSSSAFIPANIVMMCQNAGLFPVFSQLSSHKHTHIHRQSVTLMKWCFSWQSNFLPPHGEILCEQCTPAKPGTIHHYNRERALHSVY